MFQAKGVEIKLPATYLAPWKATAAELLPALCEQGGDCSDPSATALEDWKRSRLVPPPPPPPPQARAGCSPRPPANVGVKEPRCLGAGASPLNALIPRKIQKVVFVRKLTRCEAANSGFLRKGLPDFSIK
ncbi:hypothetical protein R5R35_014302 [Gryllus longicercus]|uniref:Uncharacterized protein n=1 Tax=Gryllus longicercus TaxID=2509291 RepID=A0AAN9UYY8_9ORTH